MATFLCPFCGADLMRKRAITRCATETIEEGYSLDRNGEIDLDDEYDTDVERETHSCNSCKRELDIYEIIDKALESSDE